MTDAVVIGSGVGGLSAAIVLASRGLSVEVVEAGPRAGGKIGIETIDGVEVDTGPSVLTLPHVFAELLQLAGMRLQDELPLVRPEPAFRYLYADGVVLDVHHGLDDTLASVRSTLGSAAAEQLGGFLAYAERIWSAAAPHFVYGPAPRLGGLLLGGLARLRAVARIDPLHNMRQAIAKQVRSPHLRLLLQRYATYNGSDMRCAPATLNCIAHVELSLGGFGVEGGMYQLVRTLVRAAKRLGVQLRYDSRVKSISLNGRTVSGVELDGGGRIAAPRVVANADAAHVVEGLLPPGLRSGIAIEGPRSMSAFNAIIAARRRHGQQQRVAHTVLFPADYEAEFADIFDRERAPREPTVYLCAQEASHGRPGWPEHEPVFVMANAPAEPASAAGDPSSYEALQHKVLERLHGSDLLDRDDRVVWRRTPAELAQRFAGSRGSLYGLASNGTMAAFRRPANAVPRVRGLFLASGSAHPGGGMPLAALSGRVAATAALTTALLLGVALSPCHSQAASGELSGRYVLLQQTATVSKVPVVGRLVAKSRAVSVHDLTHADDRLRGAGRLCDVALQSGSRLVRTIMPRAFKRVLPPPRVDAVLSQRDGRTVFEQGRQTVVVGARLRQPARDSMPTSPHDPRVYDQDEDGHPGVTMRVAGLVNGDIYLAQRNWSRLRGARVRQGFAGWVSFGDEQLILGTTSWMLDRPLEARPDPRQSYFRLVRVAANTSCEDALKLAEAW